MADAELTIKPTLLTYPDKDLVPDKEQSSLKITGITVTDPTPVDPCVKGNADYLAKMELQRSEPVEPSTENAAANDDGMVFTQYILPKQATLNSCFDFVIKHDSTVDPAVIESLDTSGKTFEKIDFTLTDQELRDRCSAEE